MPNYYRPQPDGTEIRESPIEGHGMFATRNFSAGERIGTTHYFTSTEIDKLRTPFGGYINHSETPNTVLKYDHSGPHVSLVAYTQTAIKAGEELTIRYATYNPAK